MSDDPFYDPPGDEHVIWLGPGVICPGCGAEVEVHMPTRADYRSPGDTNTVSLCVSCSTLSLYVITPAKTLGLRYPSGEEFDDMLRNPEVQDAIEAVRLMREEGRT